jgi:hypothetical protein
MKKINIVFLLILGLSNLFFLFSCSKKEPCNYLVHDAYFTFRVVDSYGINQIGKWGRTYLSDSVRVTKYDGTQPNRLVIDPDGHIGFFIPDDDREALDTQIVKQFFLYLPDAQGYPQNDIDTLTFKYRFKISCYEQFVVYFNDSLYHDGEYDDVMIFTKQ